MIDSITSLRFFCALYVFLFHMQLTLKIFPAWAKGFFINGFTGMAFFFILSGFVLAYRYGQEAIDYRKFAIARFARIYPPYILIVVASFFFVTPAEGRKFITYVLTNITMTQAWFPEFWTQGFNAGTWSLSVEFFFYALFPLLIVLLRKQQSGRLRIIFACCWLLSFAFGLTAKFSGLGTRFQDVAFYSVPIYRLAEFIAGTAIALLFTRDNLKVSTPWVAFVCAMYVAVCSYFNSYSLGNAMMMNVVAFPAVCAIIGYCAINNPKWLQVRTLVYLGEISYGIYLFQFLVRPVMTPRLIEMQIQKPIIAIILFVIIVFISIISYEFFEKPLRKFILARLGGRHNAVIEAVNN